MAHCTNCGAELVDGVKFCTECGAMVAEQEQKPEVPKPEAPKPEAPQQEAPAPQQQAYAQPQPAYAQQPGQGYAQPQPQPVYAQPAAAPILAQAQAPMTGSPYELITTGGFVGISLLLCIPVIGPILMLIWALGGCRKYQKRYMARAMLILTVIMLIVGLLLGLAAKLLFKNAVSYITEEAAVATGLTEEQIESIFGSYFGGEKDGSLASQVKEEQDASILSGLFGTSNPLAGLFGGAAGDGEGDDGAGGLAGLFGGLLGGEAGDLSSLIEDANKDAENHSDGWPSSLPDYPDGDMNADESYRTSFSGTTAESMWEYIETLKTHGFEYQDFYGMGLSEDDMKSMNAWWGTDGELYLSISFADGVTTIDHVTELPDYSNLFG